MIGRDGGADLRGGGVFCWQRHLLLQLNCLGDWMPAPLTVARNSPFKPQILFSLSGNLNHGALSCDFDFEARVCLARFDDDVVAGDEFFEGVASFAAVECSPFEHVGDEELGDV